MTDQHGTTLRPTHHDQADWILGASGHAFVQDLRRAHYDLGVDARPALRVAAAFTGLAEAM